jgi:hypothetical protein
VNIPIASMKFEASIADLRQRPDVKGDLEIILDSQPWRRSGPMCCLCVRFTLRTMMLAESETASDRVGGK